MSTYQKVDKTVLKDAVNKQLENLVTEKEVVIAGARLIKDGRLELEFVQSRRLRNNKLNALALLNKGDKRFNLNNRRIVRVWHMVTLEGANEAFGFDFQPIAEAAEGMTDSQRVMVMTKIQKFFVEGQTYELNIRVRETTDVAKLPKSMREDIEAGNQYAENHIMKAPTGPNNELEPVVDENGNFVYHWNELDYITPGESVDDQLVQGKKPLSKYNETFVKANSSQSVAQSQNVNIAI